MGRRISTALIALATVLFAQNKENPPATAPPERVEAPKTIPAGPGAPPADATGLAVDPRTYVIGPEDVIYINVWREPDFTRPAGVRPDGKITMPLIGDIQAAGLTPERLATQLTQALSQYINKPEISVTVAQINSKKFTIVGEVNRPGPFPLVVTTRVFEALGNAGGFKEFANKKDIVIIRGTQRLKFNWNEVVKGKKLEQNIELQNGDTILVK